MTIEEIQNKSPYLARFYEALHEDCFWGQKTINEFLEATLSFANYDKIPSRLREFSLLIEVYNHFIYTHPDKELTSGSHPLRIDKFYTMMYVFNIEHDYVGYLNRLLRKKKLETLLCKELLTFKDHYNNLIDILYVEACEYMEFPLDEALFKKDTYDYLYRIYYNDSCDFNKLITGLDKTLKQDKLFSYFYDIYEKTHNKFCYRELNFFIADYKNYEQKVNNYIRLNKIKKILP